MYQKIITDKHEDPMARFGAVLGQGLIDAGGRNATISMRSMVGSSNMNSIVGMTLFCQFWYWYPLAHGACLAFQPTAVICLNKDLQPPRFDFISNARPSLFAYPASTKAPTKEAVEKVATAVLSTTAKAKAREKEKEKDKREGDEMDSDEPATSPTNDEATGSPPKDEQSEIKSGEISPIAGSMSNLNENFNNGTPEAESKPSVKPSRRREPPSERLPNFSRVTPTQMSHISFPTEARYQPVRSLSPPSPSGGSVRDHMNLYAGGGGILLVMDRHPEEEIDLIELEEEDVPMEALGDEAAIPAPMVEDVPEATPPEPFEYPFDNDT